MTNRAILEALLARVLEGEGWDAKLNADIAVTLGGWERKWHDSERPHGWYWRRGDYSWTAEMDGYPSDYLGDLNAAVTLVPEDRDWHVQSNRSLGACWASISPAKHDLKLREWGSGMMKAATPERALIAACLKARMEAQPSSDT